MMAAKDIKIVTDNLSCPVCYQLFKNPKYLPCHHSYCEQCLEKMKVQSKIVCPECRKEATVPSGGVKGLDSNFLVNRLVDEFILKRKVEGEAEVKCDECHGRGPVVAFCPDCTLFLCHVCNEDHKRSIKSRGHHIVPLTELRSKKEVAIQPKPKAMMCREHDMELLFYCETCDQLVCVYCAREDHNGHRHDSVEKLAGKHRQELKKVTDPVHQMMRKLSDACENFDKIRNKIRQQRDEVNKKIDKHYDEVIQKLTEQKEQLKQQVHDTVSQKVKAVTTQLEEVEHLQEVVRETKELNDAVENSSDQEALSQKKRVMDCMQQTADKYSKVNLKPIPQATVEFAVTEGPLPQLGMLCSVDPNNCEIINIQKCHIKGKEAEFTIITKLDNGDCCSRGGNQVSVQLEGVNDATSIKDNNDGSYVVSFVPSQIGEVKLSVFVNDEQIKGSPYSVMVVNDYASVNKPSKIVNNDGNMGGPWGVAFGKNGMWAVADWSNNCVYLFNGEDELVRKFGTRGTNSSEFNCPAGVAFDSDDHLYVADHRNHRVQKFTIDGKYLLQFGSEGDAYYDGKLKYPRGLTISNHKLYVTNCDSECISVFKLNGKFYDTIESEELGTPYDVVISGNNQLLVADGDHHCIHTFTLDGDYVGRFGTYGSGCGQLNYPYGVAVDLCGFTLVADTNNHRVSVFDKDGNCVNCFGLRGSAPGQFVRPYGVAVNTTGIIHVSDRDNKRIQIFS